MKTALGVLCPASLALAACLALAGPASAQRFHGELARPLPTSPGVEEAPVQQAIEALAPAASDLAGLDAIPPAPGAIPLASFDQRSTLATGGLFLANLAYTIDDTKLTARVTGRGTNARTTQTGNLRLEVWASATPPGSGGSGTHFTVASVDSSPYPAAVYVDFDTGVMPLQLPYPEGSYWITVALLESLGGPYTVEAFYTFSSKYNFGGPYSSGKLAIEGTIAWNLDLATREASVQASRIRNMSSSTSGALGLLLWATTERPSYGATIQNIKTICGYALDPLGGGKAYSYVDSGRLPASLPAPGTYWMTLALVERASDGNWFYVAFQIFPEKWTFAGNVPPLASFSFSPPTPLAGQAVAFTDTSSDGPTSWTWTFGDGGTSSLQSPTHTYTSAGSFPVSLTARNGYGSNTTTKTVVVTAPPPPPAADFAYSPTAPAKGQAVTFTDRSTGSPTSWAWDFGDGGRAAVQKPTHTFVSAGAYTVSLTATNASGSHTTSKTVVVSDAPVPLVVRDARMARAVPATGCAVPSPVSAFAPTEARAYLFFSADNLTVSDILTQKWIDPSGATYGTSSWSAVEQDGNYCFTGWIVVAGYAPAAKPGIWKVQVTSSRTPGQNLVDLSFMIGSSSAREMTLAGGKVGVSCTFQSQWTGKIGAATAVKASETYGYFWFDSPSYPDAFVKVTDFAGDAYQIYHTALSDVGYMVTFTVYRTGQTYSFFRPPGSFSGMGDTVTVKK